MKKFDSMNVKIARTIKYEDGIDALVLVKDSNRP